MDNGIKWRALPADFPPWPTVYERFALWEKAGAAKRTRCQETLTPPRRRLR
ncbi:transposase [Saccharothrix deserti]|uniref:transposase n=1 Tax=Saccharothrix deserti TaxID=2593674 RepID=UPI003B75CD57